MMQKRNHLIHYCLILNLSLQQATGSNILQKSNLSNHQWLKFDWHLHHIFNSTCLGWCSNFNVFGVYKNCILSQDETTTEAHDAGRLIRTCLRTSVVMSVSVSHRSCASPWTLSQTISHSVSPLSGTVTTLSNILQQDATHAVTINDERQTRRDKTRQ